MGDLYLSGFYEQCDGFADQRLDLGPVQSALQRKLPRADFTEVWTHKLPPGNFRFPVAIHDTLVLYLRHFRPSRLSRIGGTW